MLNSVSLWILSFIMFHLLFKFASLAMAIFTVWPTGQEYIFQIIGAQSSHIEVDRSVYDAMLALFCRRIQILQ